MSDDDMTAHLADQLDWHWRSQLRPRLDGLTDDEYFWRAGAGLLDGASRRRHRLRLSRRRSRQPFTTIAWRLAHVIVGVLAMRDHSHFDGPPADYETWPYATDAATALRQLDDAYDELDRRVCAA